MITVRADAQLEDALEYLQEEWGKSRSEVIRRAVLGAMLRIESARLMADPEDVAEARALAREAEEWAIEVERLNDDPR